MAARRTTLPLIAHWPICGNGGVIRLQVAPWLHSLQDESSGASVIQSVVIPQRCLLPNMFHLLHVVAATIRFFLKTFFILFSATCVDRDKCGRTAVLLSGWSFVRWHIPHVWSYVGQAVQTKMRVRVRVSFSCDVHEGKKTQQRTRQDIVAFAAQSLAAAHALRIDFGRTLAPDVLS